MKRTEANDALKSLFARHPRSWRDNRYVYPVISRRGGGLSIGINLNPDQACNFQCVYCQVERTAPPAVRKVDLAVLRGELDWMTAAAAHGELFNDAQFANVPAEYKRLHDFAFSGDGEPTLSPQFQPAVEIAVQVRRKYGLDDVKILLITNAAYLDKPAVRAALELLDGNNGEIWAKLEAGTEEYFRLINRPNVTLRKVLDNILAAARVRPVVIQSLWMKVHGQPPPEAQVDAFAQRVRDINSGGGRIRLVQIYTIARRPAEAFVEPLENAQLVSIAARVQSLGEVPVAVYGD